MLVSESIEQIIVEDDLDNPEYFIFHGLKLTQAIDHKAIEKRYKNAFAEIGIDEEQRKSRNITFHGYRHFFNTFMRGRVKDSQLQKITGHKSIEMTEHYDHQLVEEFHIIRGIQEEMLSNGQ